MMTNDPRDLSAFLIPATIIVVCIYVWFLIFIRADVRTPQRGKIEPEHPWPAPPAPLMGREGDAASDTYRSAKYDQEMNRLRARIAEMEAEVGRYKRVAESLQTELLQAALDHNFSIPTLAARLAEYEADHA